jgi:hypothetical protein
MKHLEELTRIHTNEVIRTGLKSQTIHRAVADQNVPVAPTTSDRKPRFVSINTTLIHRFLLLYQRILNFVE